MISSLQVYHPDPHELRSAVRTLLGSYRSGAAREEQVQRCHDSLASGQYDAGGFFITRNARGQVNGAALVQVMPGSLGVAWAPRGENSDIEDALTRASNAWLRARGVKVCQAFASDVEQSEMMPLVRNGYQQVTQLVFLQRSLQVAHSENDSPSSLECTAWSGTTSHEQTQVLLETHAGTLDCPELNGVRTPAEVVAGFVPGSAENCPWWYSLHTGARMIGVLLFDQGPQRSILELSYLGLIPAARGRGLGRAALALATRIAASSGYQALSISVDVRNEPALRLYRRDGFVETDRRDVYLACWAEPTQQ